VEVALLSIKLIAVVVMMNLFGFAANAQSPVRMVAINGSENETEFEKQVVSALEARIGATARYTSGDLVKAEIVINLVCLNLSDERVVGGVCSYSFAYWPSGFYGLSISLGTLGIKSSSDTSRVGETIFQSMVKCSTEAELEKKLSALQTAVLLYAASKK
jgi:hypothetical protein